ncbi:MAG: hypothetical protein AB1500_01855 [Bacillota bacterium]
MERKHTIFYVIGTTVLALFLLSAACAFDTPRRVEIKTDKKYYLMDPYYWVYEAANFRWWMPPWDNPHWWPQGGYTRTVNFAVYLYQLNGDPAEVSGVVYEVVYGRGFEMTTGTATYGESGVYTGAFMLSESNLGGQSFSGKQPKELTIRAKVDGQIVGVQKIHVGRWGCDRCHIENNLARSIYTWCTPTGGALGPHYWGNILGRNDPSGGTDPESAEGFDLSYLTDPEKTHTPHDFLTGVNGHEYTTTRWAGSAACSPCHQGSGRLRYPWYGPNQTPSLTVKCTFCHGMEGGYLPSGLMNWPGDYTENWSIGSKWVDNAGFSALHGDCTSVSCHGDINDAAEREIDRYKPENCGMAGCHDVIP